MRCRPALFRRKTFRTVHASSFSVSSLWRSASAHWKRRGTPAFVPSELRCASRGLSNDPPAGFSEELGELSFGLVSALAAPDPFKNWVFSSVKLADGSSRWLLSWVATCRDNEVVRCRPVFGASLRYIGRETPTLIPTARRIDFGVGSLQNSWPVGYWCQNDRSANYETKIATHSSALQKPSLLVRTGPCTRSCCDGVKSAYVGWIS